MQFSNMSSIESHLCGICQEAYNESNRAPRIVCSEIHNICSECLEGLLKKAGKKFICPFDRSENTKKPLSEYPINRGFLEIAQAFLKNSSRKNCSRCQAEATRLCLECNEVQCNECILDYHEDHKKLKLADVPKLLAEKKNKLYEAVVKLETSASGKEGVNKLAKIKESELEEKANAIFDEYQRILEKKKEVVINDIRKLIAEKSSAFLAKKPQKNEKSNSEVLKWISETKIIMNEGNNGLMDNSGILCGLYKQEKLLEGLDLSKFQVNEPKEDLLFKNVLSKISLEYDKLFLGNLEENDAVKFQEKSHSAFEEVTPDFSPYERSTKKPNDSPSKDSESETSDSNNFSSDYQSQEQASEWIEKGSKSEQNPVQEEIQQLREAFEDAKLEIQVKFVKVSNSIRLDSLYEKVKSASSGFKGDEGVEKFYNTISSKELAPSLKKVISLNVTCIGLTKIGAVYLAKTVDKLSSLEVFRVEFFNSGNLKHDELKPVMQSLGRSKNLSTLSLSCQKWKYLQNFNLPYTIGDLALIGKLKDLTLNFSECHGLTTAGIAEAFHSFPSLVSLENLRLIFNGCSKLDDDQDSLKSIYQVYSRMAKLQKIQFDFLRCPDFTQRGLETLIGPSKVNPRLSVKVNI